MVHAIVLTLVRMVITQRRLLEWETAAADAPRAPPGCSRARGLALFVAEMWAGPAVALAVLLGVLPDARRARCRWRCRSWRAWLASPLVAWWLSRPVVPRRLALERRGCASVAPHRAPHLALLRALRHRGRTTGCRPTTCRRRRSSRVAHRTSPTNIGMGLLSTLAAHDLGYLGRRRAGGSDRAHARRRVEALERHEGHLLNWYDTAEPRAARAALRLDRGQRQPGGRADDARRGTARDRRRRREDGDRACARAPSTPRACWARR